VIHVQRTIEIGNIAGSRCQPRRRRRFLQFKLRSILVLTGLVGGALACWQQVIEPFRFQRAAALDIAKAGGTCRTVTVVPAWLRPLAIGHDFQEVIAVELPKPEMTSSCVSLLGRLRSLEELSVAGAAFGDEHLAKLRSLKHLREATLRGTTVTDERVAQVRAARPDLALVVEPLEISFGQDLEFKTSKDAALQAKGIFDPALLGPRIQGLVGSPVRISGFMVNNPRHSRVDRFLLQDLSDR
jgi:hypothetical protein